MSLVPLIIDTDGVALDELTFFSLPHPRHAGIVRYARTAAAVFELQAHSESAAVQVQSHNFGSRRSLECDHESQDSLNYAHAFINYESPACVVVLWC